MNKISCLSIRYLSSSEMAFMHLSIVPFRYYNEMYLSEELTEELRQQCQGPFASLYRETIVSVHTECVSLVTSSSSMFRSQ